MPLAGDKASRAVASGTPDTASVAPLDVGSGNTEFGEVLRHLVQRVPGALGAVLSDAQGDAIDYAYVRGALSELDVQIVGAQWGQAATRLDRWVRRRGLGSATLWVEGTRASVLARMLRSEYLLALMLARPANLGAAERDLDLAAQAIDRYL